MRGRGGKLWEERDRLRSGKKKDVGGKKGRESPPSLGLTGNCRAAIPLLQQASLYPPSLPAFTSLFLSVPLNLWNITVIKANRNREVEIESWSAVGVCQCL